MENDFFFTLKPLVNTTTQNEVQHNKSQSITTHDIFLRTEDKSNEKFMSFTKKKTESVKGQKSPAENFSGL